MSIITGASTSAAVVVEVFTLLVLQATIAKRQINKAKTLGAVVLNIIFIFSSNGNLSKAIAFCHFSSQFSGFIFRQLVDKQGEEHAEDNEEGIGEVFFQGSVFHGKILVLIPESKVFVV
ncbi:MAG: hypothetical protein DHS20C18_54480 [Saprospiraceae bacterium]|nr:MAG: hypothetical protein DHS20C18_54480 [Saprospiraceae bacterium]